MPSLKPSKYAKKLYEDVRSTYRDTFGLETRKSVRKMLGGFGVFDVLDALGTSTERPPVPEWGHIFDMNNKKMVECDGFGLYVMPDDYIGYSIIQCKSYEPHVTKLIRDILKRGDVFMDVGANVGYFTFLAASLVEKEGKVIAFEPNPQNLHLIYSTMLASRPAPRIDIHPFAVSDSAGILKFMTVGSNGGVIQEHKIDPTAKPLYTLLVQSVVMDKILKDEPRIDLIKMDIEAHEPAATRGMDALLRKHRPKLITEFHPWALKINNKEPPVAYLEQLYALGYRLSIIETSGNILDVSSAAEILAYWEALNFETIHLDLYAQPQPAAI